jgi:pimeloyl-[acyl-carrier protein] methyl ester esterase
MSRAGMTQSGVGQLHVERSAPAGRPVGELPLVMLHGWGMNLRVFDRLREDLARETWAIDLPGHGRSPWWPEASAFDVQRDAVLAVLPPCCVLVGWSLGAKLALSLAAVPAQRVAALVLLSPSPRFLRGEDWPQGADPAALGTARRDRAGLATGAR